MIDLPWDAEGTIIRSVAQTVSRTGATLHARATSLAREAMNRVAFTATVSADADTDIALEPVVETDYARAKADYARRLAENRRINMQAHIEANNRRAAEAAERRKARQEAHAARNAAAAEEARQRRLAKAA